MTGRDQPEPARAGSRAARGGSYGAAAAAWTTAPVCRGKGGGGRCFYPGARPAPPRSTAGGRRPIRAGRDRPARAGANRPPAAQGITGCRVADSVPSSPGCVLGRGAGGGRGTRRRSNRVLFESPRARGWGAAGGAAGRRPGKSWD